MVVITAFDACVVMGKFPAASHKDDNIIWLCVTVCCN